MKNNRLLKSSSYIAFGIAVVLFFYVLSASKALSYFSSDSINCINCHVMNTEYATWQHGSHSQKVSCVDCHLPAEGFFGKYFAKARDGWNHSVAFTFSTYDQSIKISEDAAERVQENCISCHSNLTETMIENSSRYDSSNDGSITDRKCWDCHREIPHGKTRSLTTTPYNLGVRELE